MSSQSFVIVIDTPSVKRYVFGTDPLNEVRGASTRLDRLNREEMERVLRQHAGTASVEKIYANGGSAQFLLHQCCERTVEAACRDVVDTSANKREAKSERSTASLRFQTPPRIAAPSAKPTFGCGAGVNSPADITVRPPCRPSWSVSRRHTSRRLIK